MNKIVTGMLSIALTLSLVAGVAYANFTSFVEVKGVTLAAATPGLQVLLEDNTLLIDSDESKDVSSYGPVKLAPGQEGNDDFKFKNIGGVDLALSGKLTPTSGDPALKDLVQIRFVNQEDNTKDSGWRTLTQWESGRSLNYTIVSGDEVAYKIYYRMLSTADDNVKHSTITFDFRVTGTQP